MDLINSKNNSADINKLIHHKLLSDKSYYEKLSKGLFYAILVDSRQSAEVFN